jgi:hypothetical protein
MACERLMERKNENQRLCGRRKCKAEYAALQRHVMLGRYADSPSRFSDARKPINTGTFSPVSSGPRWRQVAGPAMSAEELHLATVGAPVATWVPPRPTPGNSALIGPTDEPINLIGGYRFPHAIERLPASAKRDALSHKEEAQ